MTLAKTRFEYVAMSALAQLSPVSLTGQIVEKTGIIAEIISESSGVAVSRRYPGILWTHNDSGHSPVIYAITMQGDVVAALAVPGASMRDWEDMAIGPCPPATMTGSQHCIYVADTGDNFERRRTVQIYIVPEPDPRLPGVENTERAIRVDFRYPDRSTDVEAMAVDPSGTVWLVSKGRTWPIRLFSLDLGFLPAAPREPLQAMATDTLGLPHIRLAGWVTGAAISPTGDRLVVRTYLDIYSYLRSGNRWVPLPPACHIGAIEPQGEAIDFVDERTYVLTSEALRNRPGPIYRIVCS